MDDVQAKMNICKIFYRRDNMTEPEVFGCGSLVKCGKTLKVATSSKIRKLTGEVFAEFQGGEIKLQVDNTDEHEEHLGSEDGKIAYVSFDDTAFKQNSDAGFYKEDKREGLEEMVCRVPVVDNFEKFGKRNEFNEEFYEVVKEQGKVSLKLQQGSNTRVLENKREVETKHSMVLGCPILSQQNKFLGIVDFLDVDNESLFDLIYLGTQRNGTDDSDGTPPRQRRQLSLADPLRDLWENNIEFRGTFSGVLDVKYSNVRSWPHLAEQFGIDKLTYEAFSASDISSPSERLFNYLETTEPDWNIEELCKSLKEADANDVCRIVEQKIKAGELRKEDLVSELCDNAPSLLNKIVLKLDREERLWHNLARQKKIPRKKYLSFKSNGCDNRARVLFDCLQTEAPDRRVADFKGKLKKLRQANVLKTLTTFRIEDNMLLKDISSPKAKTEIETTLNNNETGVVWELAELYQKEGLMQDIDIGMVFRPQQDVNSPTCKLMEYVLACHPREPTIEDLVLKLKEIKRIDCVFIIEPYLTESGREEVKKIRGEQRLDNIQSEQSNGGKQPSTDDEERVSVPASDQSENKYLLEPCQPQEAS